MLNFYEVLDLLKFCRVKLSSNLFHMYWLQFLKDDQGSHLKEDYQANILGKEIINLLK